MENQKYFKAEKIFARLASRHKNKMGAMSIGTIIEWCAEIETEVIGNWAQFERYDKHEITRSKKKFSFHLKNIFRLICIEFSILLRKIYVNSE